MGRTEGARLTLVGRLEADPGFHPAAAGGGACCFRVGVNGGLGSERRPVWYRVWAAGALGVSAYERLRRGCLVEVAGWLRPQRWLDRSGLSWYSLDVEAESVVCLEGSADWVAASPDGAPF